MWCHKLYKHYVLLCNSFVFIFQAYDPELFSKALPCLSAIGCALSPDYSLSSHAEDIKRYAAEADETYTPNPVNTAKYVS